MWEDGEVSRVPACAPEDPPEAGTPLLDQAEQVYHQTLRSLGAEREQREGQYQMIRQVVASLQDRQHRVVHAGTGVGKSLGYLVPIAAALRTQRLQRAVISTATRALQDQLLRKDLPLVLGQHPGAFQVLKGRSNYLCVDKLRQGMRDWEQSQSLLVEPGRPGRDAERFLALVEWNDRQLGQPRATGERTSLPPKLRISDSLWERVSTGPEECPGADVCPSGGVCWAERARRRAREAQVVVVNHHLWVLAASGRGEPLPAHQLLVLDEAHELLDVASNTLGCRLSPGTLFARSRQLGRLLGPEAQTQTRALAQAAQELAQTLDGATAGVSLHNQPPPVRQQLHDTLQSVRSLLGELRGQLAQRSPGGRPGAGPLQRAGRSLLAVLDAVERLADPEPDPNRATWVEGTPPRRALVQAQVDPSQTLRSLAWTPGPPALLCSATFHPAFTQWVGLSPGGRWGGLHRVPSPFDYPNQALLYVPEGLPTPPSGGRSQQQFWELQLREIQRLLQVSEGDALVLFTSWSALRYVGDRLQHNWSLPGPLLRQDSDMSRAQLVDQLACHPHSVLLGVRSFWQGVDVRGEALRLVIIDRLPFPSPRDPLVEARSQLAERRGQRGFDQVFLPVAAQLLAQGVGRLIRSSSDRGAVAVLDPRLAEASYRSQLLAQLPPVRRTRNFDQVRQWFDGCRRHPSAAGRPDSGEESR